jgi:hypothetical protein
MIGANRNDKRQDMKEINQWTAMQETGEYNRIHRWRQITYV